MLKIVLGCSFLLSTMLSLSSIASVAVVDAQQTKWHSGQSLDANATYIVSPDPHSRWSLARNQKADFHGIDDIDGSAIINVPVNLRLGGLAVLVWHHMPNGQSAVPEIISFPQGQDYAQVKVGQQGGSIHFLFVDKTGTYADNSGVARVHIDKDDGIVKIFELALPISVSNGFSTWTIDQRGAVQGSIKYTVGSGSGLKKYLSGLVVEFFDDTTYTADSTKTIGRPFSGTTNGTETFSKPSIPLKQLRQIRRVYVLNDVDKGDVTIREWKDRIIGWIQDADKDYQKLKKNGLVQDAYKAYAATL